MLQQLLCIRLHKIICSIMDKVCSLEQTLLQRLLHMSNNSVLLITFVKQHTNKEKTFNDCESCEVKPLSSKFSESKSFEMCISTSSCSRLVFCNPWWLPRKSANYSFLDPQFQVCPVPQYRTISWTVWSLIPWWACGILSQELPELFQE